MGSNNLLSNRTGQAKNRNLKVIGAKAGIPFDISIKTARITCSQLVSEAGIANQLLIDSFIGWSGRNKICSSYFYITGVCKWDYRLHPLFFTEPYVNLSVYNRLLNYELLSSHNPIHFILHKIYSGQ
jgi:hypothetical protein